MTMPDLTFRQRLIILFVTHYVKVHKHAPTVREIAEACGLASSASAHNQLWNLRNLGWVDWESGKPRTLRVVGPWVEV